MSPTPRKTSTSRFPAQLALGLAGAFALASVTLAEPPATAVNGATPDGARLFTESCASCHGADRLGLLAPPLMQQTLARFKTDAEIRELIRKGLPGTRMPSFKLTLDDASIDAIIAHIRQPVDVRFGEPEILKSQRTFPAEESEVHLQDADDVTAVVERGTGNLLFIQDHQLIKEVFFPIVHGGLKYVGEHLYVPARTGFILKLDVATIQPLRQVRAGVYLRNIEVSPRFILAATSLPPAVTFFDHDLTLKKVMPLDDAPAAITRLDEDRFLITFLNTPRLLILKEDEVVREVKVGAPYTQCARLGDMVVGTNGNHIYVTDFEQEATIEDSAMPHIAAGEFWKDGDATLWATPKIDSNGVTIYRVERGAAGTPIRLERVHQVEATALPVRGHTNTFVRSHPKLDFLVTTSGSDVLIVSKQDFSIRRTLTPAKGKMALHTEFSKDGSTLFISVWDERGGIYMYNTADFTLQAVIPASKPAGQYNRFMKTWRN